MELADTHHLSPSLKRWRSCSASRRSWGLTVSRFMR
jgi:hypothetical protein